LPRKSTITALTEVKHKNMWSVELSEFNLDGYCMFSNNLEDNSRGILIYVSKDIKCTEIFPDIGFSECVILELEDVSHHKMNIATI